MAHACKPKQKCRILCRTVNKYFPAINLLCSGLLASVVFLATINFVPANAIECGTVNLYRTTVLGGNEAIKDEWPFIAALYYSSTSEYFCGGTIISQKHVLTAAHCIQTKGTGVPRSPEEITVRVGAFNLTDRGEKDAVNRNVTQIYVHPDWKFNEEKYDADIAILVLNENISFSNHIRPVCMPPVDFMIDGLMGTVVGWGKTESGTAEGIPRKIEIIALNDTYCYERDKGIARYASERSFCGEGSGTPNDGDSGGGFFAAAGSGWVQFGTVSFVRPEATGNNMKIAMYMKLPSLRDWITDKVEQSGGKIGLAKTKAVLNCNYGYTSDGVYGCWLFELNIRQENFEVQYFIGTHSFYKNNDDVEMIKFETGVMASLPRNIGNFFKNLKFLVITVDTRRIFRSNFQSMERLEQILFRDGRIKELDENSLWDLPNLQFFGMDTNELKLLHASTFSRNYKLERVRVLLNALKSLPQNLFRSNSLLCVVSFNDNSIETIDERIFETNANLREVFLKKNRLTHFNENLFKNNLELQFVDLSYNLIKTIDEQTFTANSKLLALSLASNELEFLPAQQGNEFLEEFDAQINPLKAIDERFFETMVRIKKIGLHYNQLTHIPTNLFRHNSRLISLRLDHNAIEEIDENLFEKNVLLENVSLQSNRLVDLPANLFKHNSMLKFVDVSWNSLQTIDERTFEWNTRLREINFWSNDLAFLPRKLFQNNSLLETVRLWGNTLEAIDEHTFQTNANLRKIDFSWNRLKYLPEILFRNNSLLQIVNLSGNLFTTLYENIFVNNANLENIILQRSRLQSLPRNLFQGNSRLKYIDLSDSSLKAIEINFSALKHASLINLSGCVCINAVFHDDESDTYVFSNETRRTKNLIEFQDIVIANCSQ